LSTSGKPTFLRTLTNQKKTDGGAQNPRSQVLKKTRRKSTISQRSWNLSPKETRPGKEGLPPQQGRRPAREQAVRHRHVLSGEGGCQERPAGGEPPRTKKTRRRKLRKKVTKDKDHEWELARQDAWLREMLTDSSGSESEDKYARFAESGRWIAEMTGIPQQATTTSRGECSGQEKPDS
jgi:hypothetical protein